MARMANLQLRGIRLSGACSRHHQLTVKEMVTSRLTTAVNRTPRSRITACGSGFPLDAIPATTKMCVF